MMSAGNTNNDADIMEAGETGATATTTSRPRPPSQPRRHVWCGCCPMKMVVSVAHSLWFVYLILIFCYTMAFAEEWNNIDKHSAHKIMWILCGVIFVPALTCLVAIFGAIKSNKNCLLLALVLHATFVLMTVIGTIQYYRYPGEGEDAKVHFSTIMQDLVTVAMYLGFYVYPLVVLCKEEMAEEHNEADDMRAPLMGTYSGTETATEI